MGIGLRPVKSARVKLVLIAHLCLCRAVYTAEQRAKSLHLQQVLQVLVPQSAQKGHVELREQLHLAVAACRNTALPLSGSAKMLCATAATLCTGVYLKNREEGKLSMKPLPVGPASFRSIFMQSQVGCKRARG